MQQEQLCASLGASSMRKQWIFRAIGQASWADLEAVRAHKWKSYTSWSLNLFSSMPILQDRGPSMTRDNVRMCFLWGLLHKVVDVLGRFMDFKALLCDLASQVSINACSVYTLCPPRREDSYHEHAQIVQIWKHALDSLLGNYTFQALITSV